MGKECSDCGEKPAMLWMDDGVGFCWQCAIDYAEEQIKHEELEERTGISQLDIINRAMEKKIPIPKAKEELLKEKGWM